MDAKQIKNIKRILLSTKNIMSFLKDLKENNEYDLARIKFYRSRNIFSWCSFFFLNREVKKNLENVQYSLNELAMKRLELRCKLFKSQELQRDLKAALKKEDYEAAAVIRDIINENQTISK